MKSLSKQIDREWKRDCPRWWMESPLDDVMRNRVKMLLVDLLWFSPCRDVGRTVVQSLEWHQ